VSKPLTLARTSVCKSGRRAGRSLAVLVAALSMLTATALAYADGIDLSHWQGSVSWSRVKSDGVTFAFMKATEGTSYSDPTLRTNWDGAESHGIYRSAYHFARPSVGSAERQAEFFVKKVGSFKGKGDLPPVLDLEATGGLSASQLRRWVRNWLETTEKLTGRTPILYFSPYFWIDHLGNSTDFTRYPLWIAHYTSGKPLVPGGWKTWTFWQRTSSGSVEGISGHVDMNRFNGTSAQLAKLANTTGGSSAPPPSGPTVPVGKATSLSLGASTLSPAIHQTVTFSGDLAGTTPVRALPGRDVSLWGRAVGSSTWRQVGETTATDTDGHYALTSLIRQPTDYQMRWAGGSKYAASASPVVRLTTPARTATAVDLHKDKTTVRKGAALMLYGHVTDADSSEGVAGLTVRYYKRTVGGGRWILVGKCKSLAPTGWHSIVVHPKVKREWRVVVTHNDFYKRSTSNQFVVRPR
jgi:GH25 family lysozyme M1 (1,4-beta-N-acetylmuramidase)